MRKKKMAGRKRNCLRFETFLLVREQYFSDTKIETMLACQLISKLVQCSY